MGVGSGGGGGVSSRTLGKTNGGCGQRRRDEKNARSQPGPGEGSRHARGKARHDTAQRRGKEEEEERS